MGRANSTVIFGFFVAVIAAICGVSLLKGGFYVGKHEGDTLHMLQIVLRMVEGQRPHLDFMTPIGVLAFAPIAMLVKLGFGVGMATLWSQAVVSILFLPAVWWASVSRMRGLVPYLFGLIVFVLIGAVVYGESESSVSISMHYNRWAWAAAFVLIAVVALPVVGNRNEMADGVVVGLMVSALALTKVTYFVAFFPPAAVALLVFKAYRTMLVAAIVGVISIAAVTVWAGFDYWSAYLLDILRVTASESRAKPGLSFSGVVAAPAYLGASLVLIASIIFLRQGGQKIGGLLLLLFTPGFFYVAYQNFGNDPQWLQILVVLLLSYHVADGEKNQLGWDSGRSVQVLAAVAMAMGAPSFFNLAYSPFRHFSTDPSLYTAILPRSDVHGDLLGTKTRAARTDTRTPIPNESIVFAEYADMAGREKPTQFNGEVFPDCQMTLGYTAWFQVVSDELETAGLAKGKSLFAADLFSSYWLFGSLEPVKNGAPWFYGGLPGIMNANYLIVPMCPIIPEVREQILSTINKQKIEFVEVHRTELYVVYERLASGS